MNVYQNQYDSFYNDIEDLVNFGCVKLPGFLAAEPRKLSPEEKKRIEIEEQLFLERMPKNEQISLSNRSYGFFVDMYYKETFIQLMKQNRVAELNELKRKIAEEIKQDPKCKEIMYWIRNPDAAIAAARDKDNLSEKSEQKVTFDNINSLDLFSGPEQKTKSFIDKIKDFLNL